MRYLATLASTALVTVVGVSVTTATKANLMTAATEQSSMTVRIYRSTDFKAPCQLVRRIYTITETGIGEPVFYGMATVTVKASATVVTMTVRTCHGITGPILDEIQVVMRLLVFTYGTGKAVAVLENPATFTTFLSFFFFHSLLFDRFS